MYAGKIFPKQRCTYGATHFLAFQCLSHQGRVFYSLREKKSEMLEREEWGGRQKQGCKLGTMTRNLTRNRWGLGGVEKHSASGVAGLVFTRPCKSAG